MVGVPLDISSLSHWASMAKYCRLGGSETTELLLTVQEAEVPDGGFRRAGAWGSSSRSETCREGQCSVGSV